MELHKFLKNNVRMNKLHRYTYFIYYKVVYSVINIYDNKFLE